MKFSKLALAAALALATSPAALLAQDIAVGATIYGSDGEPIGTVTQVDEGAVTVNTGTHTAALPTSAIGPTEKGPGIAMTKAELDGQIAQVAADQAAKLEAALVAGAAVADIDGTALGTIKSADEASVIVTSQFGDFTLQPTNFTLQGDALIAAVRAADVEAQLQGSAG